MLLSYAGSSRSQDNSFIQECLSHRPNLLKCNTDSPYFKETNWRSRLVLASRQNLDNIPTDSLAKIKSQSEWAQFSNKLGKIVTICGFVAIPVLIVLGITVFAATNIIIVCLPAYGLILAGIAAVVISHYILKNLTEKVSSIANNIVNVHAANEFKVDLSLLAEFNYYSADDSEDLCARKTLTYLDLIEQFSAKYSVSPLFDSYVNLNYFKNLHQDSQTLTNSIRKNMPFDSSTGMFSLNARDQLKDLNDHFKNALINYNQDRVNDYAAREIFLDLPILRDIKYPQYKG